VNRPQILKAVFRKRDWVLFKSPNLAHLFGSIPWC